MVLNYIWIGLILIAILFGIINTLLFGDMDVLYNIQEAITTSAKTGFEVSIGLTGVLACWMGIMKIGEKAGVVEKMATLVSPFFSRLFPQVPKGHKSFSSIFMNLSATMLGIDNAATPMGLKAMNELQEINDDKSKASDAMIMFLVLVTSGLTLIPVSIIAMRSSMHAANPADVFIPILLATMVAAVVGIISVAVRQKIRLLDPVIIGVIGGMIAIAAGVVLVAKNIPQEQLDMWSKLIASTLLLGVIVWFIIRAMIAKINVYDAFIEGAKGGFQTAVGIIPYLIAILVAVAMFRASGAMDLVIRGIAWFFALLGINTDFVPALPTAFMRPLSGSGARGMMVEAMQQYGPDSFVGRLVSIVQGSTDTTFYILAVYFGSVNIKETRYAVVCGLLADLAGILAAIFIAYIFFH